MSNDVLSNNKRNTINITLSDYDIQNTVDITLSDYDVQPHAAHIELQEDDFGTLAICAIRYCHGRQTYMPDLVMSIVRPHLRELSNKDLNVMIEDCEFQRKMHLYGDEHIDRPGWLKWMDELIAEMERRKK